VEKWRETGNVYENKRSYLPMAEIYMKTGRLILSVENQPESTFRCPAAAGFDCALANLPRKKVLFCTSNAGMSMKKKDSCGKVGLKRECS
jgi:hypothetical protein